MLPSHGWVIRACLHPDMKSMVLASRVADDHSFVVHLHNQGRDLAAGFRLCFSLLGPATAGTNCKIIKQLAGYTELTPADGSGLEQGADWKFTVSYGGDILRPFNQSWSLTAAYVVSATDEVIEVDAHNTGFPPAAVAKSEVGSMPQLAIFPSPHTLTAGEGICPITRGLNIAATDIPQAQAALEQTVALGKRIGLPGWQKQAGLPVQLAVDDDLAMEAYRLQLGSEGITLSATKQTGFQYGLTSLLQMATLHGEDIPCGTLTDSPRFNWRGLHLDCARHYYCVSTILRLLDLLALLKINRFHWHMHDDEAFRLELESLPELARRTALRGHGCLLPGVFGGGSGPTGGVYSKSNVATVVGHATNLGIGVMPEIEVPAHCWSLLQIMPEMRDPDDRSLEVSIQGYPANTLNPAMPATWDFLRQAIPEINAMFPLGVIHLGCDERPPGSWKTSPLLEKWKQLHGLGNDTDVQEKMMQDVSALVRNCGGRPAAWEEAAQGRNGGIGSDTLLFSWSGQGPGLEAARAGYDVVMAPGQNAYMDMAPDTDPGSRGINWAAIIGLGDTLAWDPIPADEPGLAKHIVGVQACMWSETIIVDKHVEPMLVPRLLGIAEMGWATRQKRMSPTTLRAVALAWDKVFAAMQWQCGKAN